jgi:hypothetical protein
VEFISPILINFHETRKLIKNSENNFTDFSGFSLILVDYRDFRQKIIQLFNSRPQNHQIVEQIFVLPPNSRTNIRFEKNPQIVETTSRD